jgi:hypothetical protein
MIVTRLPATGAPSPLSNTMPNGSTRKLIVASATRLALA